MRRALIRLSMAVVGVLSLVVYTAGAYGIYLVLRFVWADRPSAVTIVVVLAAVSLGLGFLSYRLGTRQLLETLEAVPVDPIRAPGFFDRLDRLCARMDVDRPQVLLTDLEEPNAFAVGSPEGGIVVFDRSLLSLLDGEELEGILAHELAHLESRDGLVQLLAFTGLQTVMGVVSVALLPVFLVLTGLAKASAWFRGAPSTWSNSLAWQFRTVVVAVVVVVPAIVTFVLLARSRRREYAADARAAEVTGKPLALARALRTVDAAMRHDLLLRGLLPEESTPSDPFYRLLSTHPAVEERIARLERLAGG